MSAVAPAQMTLGERLVSFELDPEGFVWWAFPWGQGVLAGRRPHDWQLELLRHIGEQLRCGAMTVHEAIQCAIASGHGIGKSALVSWLIIWAMATKRDTRGVVTANTEAQLKSKTWPELGKWHALTLDGIQAMFQFTATAYYYKAGDELTEKAWRIDMVPWSVNRSEAFAGLHNAGKRIILIFDEASAIENVIWEVAEGALTDEDTQIIWCAFGNPTRNQGRFHESVFGKRSHRWWHRSIDSRTVPGTNKAQIKKWEQDEGEDSDFFRVRVRGIAPRASFNQYIPIDLVQGARTRVMQYVTPKVACVGVDVARFGGDQSVIRTRIGRDARSIPVKRFRDMKTTRLVTEIGDHVNYLKSLGLRVVLFVDGGTFGGGVVDMLQDLGYEVIEVLFGAGADNPKRYGNKRAEMYGRMKEWLKVGYLPEDDEQLQQEACAVLYSMPKDVIQLERKELLRDREGFSPDDADALACTFAYPVPPVHSDEPGGQAPTNPNSAAAKRRAYSSRSGGTQNGMQEPEGPQRRPEEVSHVRSDHVGYRRRRAGGGRGRQRDSHRSAGWRGPGHRRAEGAHAQGSRSAGTAAGVPRAHAEDVRPRWRRERPAGLRRGLRHGGAPDRLPRRAA